VVAPITVVLNRAAALPTEMTRESVSEQESPLIRAGFRMRAKVSLRRRESVGQAHVRQDLTKIWSAATGIDAP
jgi:hypothetical protein